MESFLDSLASRERVPASGVAAAAVAGMAAALVAKGARLSTAVWPDADGAAVQAETLRRRAAELGESDAAVYAAALTALDEPTEADADRRNWQLGEALAFAADAPLQIAALAADVADLAAQVAELGNPELRPDVAGAAVLAEAAARIAAHLVEINLGALDGDVRVARAQKLVADSAAAAERALAP